MYPTGYLHYISCSCLLLIFWTCNILPSLFPQAGIEEVNENTEKPNTIDITVSATGEYTINLTPIKFISIESLRDALQVAAQNMTDPFIIINADAKAAHQSVITVMEAARLAGHSKITFTTETSPQE